MARSKFRAMASESSGPWFLVAHTGSAGRSSDRGSSGLRFAGRCGTIAMPGR